MTTKTKGMKKWGKKFTIGHWPIMIKVGIGLLKQWGLKRLSKNLSLLKRLKSIARSFKIEQKNAKVGKNKKIFLNNLSLETNKIVGR